jgi:hypothetical protein
MIGRESSLSAERLRELMDYDSESGIFTRKVQLCNRHKVGDRADFQVGSGSAKGYCRVTVDGRQYMAHRLAWLHVYGAWPSLDIDHINGIRFDNRIENLRNVTPGVNLENIRNPRVDNKSGFLGVHSHYGRWRARLVVGRRSIHVGCFDTPEEAHEEYLKAKRKLHKGCTI